MPAEPSDTYKKVLLDRAAIKSAGYDFDAISENLDVNLEGTPLKNVSEFKYLGKVKTTTNSDSPAIKARLVKFQQIFFNLKRKVFLQTRLNRKLKLKIYNAVVVPQLTYATETMVLRKTDENRINTVHRRHLRSITGVNTYLDSTTGEVRYPPDSKVYQAAECGKISDLIRCRKVRFYGHILRRPARSDLRFLLGAKDVVSLHGIRSRTDRMNLVPSLVKLSASFGLRDEDALVREVWRRKVKGMGEAFVKTAQTEPQPQAVPPLLSTDNSNNNNHANNDAGHSPD